ncbi:MAG: ATP synthase beta subunit C-terminal domain-containing protein, partial [Sphaerochaetaceae bacterium]
RISEFYERAGMTENLNGTTGSVSVIGAVSPPGGDFSEPVTQHTKRFVRCFWGLDKALASARHYPAISWLDSYSEYVQDVQEWWDKASGGQWSHDRQEIMELLQKEVKLQQVVKLVGADALPDSQNFILEVCKMFKVAFLQQNAFDDMDKYCEVKRQVKMLRMIIRYYELGSEAIKGNVTLVKIRRIKAVQDLARMRNVEDLDSLQARLEHSIKQLGELYE